MAAVGGGHPGLAVAVHGEQQGGAGRHLTPWLVMITSIIDILPLNVSVVFMRLGVLLWLC